MLKHMNTTHQEASVIYIYPLDVGAEVPLCSAAAVHMSRDTRLCVSLGVCGGIPLIFITLICGRT